MKISRIASVPLLLQDPYVSIWSPHDRLNEGDTTHWCGKPQRLSGDLIIDGRPYCYLGMGKGESAEQLSLDVSATTTTVCFKAEGVELTVRFCSPLLLSDRLLVSRPCSYVDFAISGATEGRQIQVRFQVSSDIVREHEDKGIVGGVFNLEDYHCAWMGNSRQAPLSESGDNVTIDWGNCYLTSADKWISTTFDPSGEFLSARWDACEERNTHVVFAFDDHYSIQYFGETRKGYWTTVYKDIFEAIGAAEADHDELVDRCEIFDRSIEQIAREAGGEDYAFLCSCSYRQTVAAHKLITDDDGNLIFLSKENDSNGCIGTVDVSYPSVPLLLLFDPEYVRGMMRPIFRFARSRAWEYDFAPHDVGRYPYAIGQVYGLNHGHDAKNLASVQNSQNSAADTKTGTADTEKTADPNLRSYDSSQTCIYPAFWTYPDGRDLYDFAEQMPVEECGNMLIMAALVTLKDRNLDFIREQMDLFDQWVEYLVKYGMDPGEQLCTDDFAGHLAHNINLSAKAILGIKAYAILEGMLGDSDMHDQYLEIAKEMAARWKKDSREDDHSLLAYGIKDTWSLKYNLVIDRLLGEGRLFEQELLEREADYYLKVANRYGTPLDSRADYTKSDWILWCCAMTNDGGKRRALMAPVADYLKNTKTRVPFGDWYDTKTGKYCQFIARSVQGGIYMPLLVGVWEDEEVGF